MNINKKKYSYEKKTTWRNLPLISIFLIIFCALPLNAQNAMRIVAIVNDNIITLYDMTQRINIINLSNGITSDTGAKQDISNNVLHMLIDENIKLQEAAKQNIHIRNKEIEDQINVIAQSNNMSREEFNKFLLSRNIDIASIYSQIKSQMAWKKTLAKTIRYKINIGQDEINAEIDRLAANNNNIQKRVFNIFILKNQANIDQIDVKKPRDIIKNILLQFENGTSFSSLARNYSQDSTSAVGGDIGWVSKGQLQRNIDIAVNKLNANDKPIVVETSNGFHIIFVSDQRPITVNINDIKFNLSQIIIPLDANLSQQEHIDIANDLVKLVNDFPVCGISEKDISPFKKAKLIKSNDITFGKLSPLIKKSLKDIKTGQTAKPVIINNTLILISVCKRYNIASNEQLKIDIANNLGQQRLELLARQYLRDLKNAAFIEVRM